MIYTIYTGTIKFKKKRNLADLRSQNFNWFCRFCTLSYKLLFFLLNVAINCLFFTSEFFFSSSFFYEIQKQYYIHIYMQLSWRQSNHLHHQPNNNNNNNNIIIVCCSSIVFIKRRKKITLHTRHVCRSFFFWNMLFNIFRLICCREALYSYKREKKKSMLSFSVNTNYSYNMIMIGK